MNWMREQAAEGLQHATEAGEEITSLGGRVSLGIGELAGTHHESIDDILRELIVLESDNPCAKREALEHHRRTIGPAR